MSSLTGPVPSNALASVLLKLVMEPLFRLLEWGVPWQRCSLGYADKMVRPEWVDRSAGVRDGRRSRHVPVA